MVKGYPTWELFDAKNAHDTDAFETLCRLLFKKQFGIKDALPYALNNAGNETKPITVGDEVIGFQAKYFDGNTIDESQTRKLIHSIETAHANYPDQTKQIIYSKIPFGNPPAGKEKTKNEEDIEAAAINNHIEIEWIFGNDILDKVIENELLYDIFFNLEVHLKELHKHVKYANALYEDGIKDSVRTSDGDIAIPRQEVFLKLEELLVQGKDVAIEGESGSGKSAIVKNYCQQHNDDVTIWLNASQLETDDVNTLFQFAQSYTIDNVCSFYQNNDKKIVIIDSAEKLLGLKNPRPLALLLRQMHEEKWQFIFTIRMSAAKRVEKLIQDKGVLLEAIEAPLLSNDELKTFMRKNALRIPTDHKLYGRIHNLFYLARYCEIVDGKPNSLREFREQVWEEKIKGGVGSGDATREARERLVLDLTKAIVTEGKYIISKEHLSGSEIGELIRDEIIISNPVGYSFTHDIYREWAQSVYLDALWGCTGIVDDFLNELGGNLIAINGFRRWLGEKIEERDACVSEFVDRVFTDTFDKRMRSAILTTVMQSKDYAPEFFERYDGKLKEENFKWGASVLADMVVNCQVLMGYLPYNGENYPIMRPEGSGWDCAITFIEANYEQLAPQHGTLINEILGSYPKIKEKDDILHRSAGLMALRPHTELAESRKRGEYGWYETDDKAFHVVACYYKYIHPEIKIIIYEIIANQWVNYDDPYSEFARYVAKAEDMSLSWLYKQYPKEILDLMDVYWSAPDKEEDDRHIVYTGSRIYEEETAWGLSRERLSMFYYPVSAYQTCIREMLELYPKETTEFIIRFVDKCTHHYAELMAEEDPLAIMEIMLSDGTKRTKLGNQNTWNIYRGTPSLVQPQLMKCIHMALEDYLITQLGKENGKEKVKSILDTVLDKAESASLVAVAASVVTYDTTSLEEEAIALTSNLKMLYLDRVRCTMEFHSKATEMGAPRNFALLDERKKSNALAHRKRSLEDVLFEIQAYYEFSKDDTHRELAEKAYSNVELLKAQLEDVPEDWRMQYSYILSGVDVRAMEKEEFEEDGQTQILFKPKLSKEQEALSEQSETNGQEMMRGMNLRMWASCRMKRNFDLIKNSVYEKNPQQALADCKNINGQLEIQAGGLTLLPDDEYVPSMACAVLLKDFGEQFSAEDRTYCEKEVIDSLENFEWMLASPLSGLRECLNVIPTLLESNDVYNEECNRILRSYAAREREVDGVRSCEIVAQVVEDYALWAKQRDFMRGVVEAFVHEKPDSSAWTMKDAQTLLSLFAQYPADEDMRQYANTCLEIMSLAWDESDMERDYVHIRIYSSDIIARVVLSAPDDVIPNIASYYARYLPTSSHDTLLSRFMAWTAYYGKYGKWRIVWKAFYQAVVIERSRGMYDEVLSAYMLNPKKYFETREDWFKMGEEDVPLMAKIAEDAGDRAIVLKNIVNITNTMAKVFYMKMLPVIDIIVSKHPALNLKDYQSDVVFGLETVCRRVNDEHGEEMNMDVRMRERMVRLLEFMARRGSAYASRLIATM